MRTTERDFVLPEDETTLFDDLRFYVYTKNMWGLLIYIRKLLEAIGYDYKK